MKNTIITLLCFAALLMLGGFASVKMMAKLDDEADRVASLEGRVEDLNGINYELNNEIASLTDALDQRDADLHTITDALQELQEVTTEEEVDEVADEVDDEAALESDYDGDGLVFSATKDDGATSSKVPIQEPEEEDFDVYYADDEPPADNSSSNNMTYWGVYELTAYEYTGCACADGVMPQIGYTVASNDPSLWHKWIYIEGVGDRYVHDTGGMAISCIDIYMGDVSTCLEFGRRSAAIYVYN